MVATIIQDTRPGFVTGRCVVNDMLENAVEAVGLSWQLISDLGQNFKKTGVIHSEVEGVTVLGK
jgi:hypothetical protein